MRPLTTHSLIFLCFLIIFGFFFHNGNIVHGDFATAFLYTDLSYLKIFLFGWLDNFFLGYPSLIYTFPRIPFYLMMDIINNLFSFKYWWLYFPILFFVRYYFFYKLLDYFGSKHIYSVLIALIYSINFYFLDRSAHLYLIFASTGLPMLLYYYLSFLKRSNLRNFLGINLSLFLIFSNIHVTVLAIYLILPIFAYEMFNFLSINRLIVFIRKNVLLLLTSILLFCYLLLPLFSYIISLKNNQFQTLSKDLIYDSIFHYSNLSNIPLTIFGVGFHGSEIFKFDYVLYLFLFFAIVNLILILFISRKPKYYHIFLFEFIVFLFLSSYNLLGPFIGVLKAHLPGFDLFTDSSMITIVVVFFFYLLLGLSLSTIRFKVVTFYLFAYLILSISILILYLVNFDTYKKVVIPSNYRDIPTYIRNANKVYIYPPDWVQKFSWSGNLIMSGFFSMYLADFRTVGPYIVEGTLPMTKNKLGKYNECFRKNCSILPQLTLELGIDYIIHFKGTPYDGSRLKSIANIKASDLIDVVEENKYFSIYRFKISQKPNIYSRDITYNRVNPSLYIVEFNNNLEKNELNFLNSYDVNWKLKKLPDNYSLYCPKVKINEMYNIRECITDVSLFRFDLIPLLLNTNDDINIEHKVLFNYANKWIINDRNEPKDSKGQSQKSGKYIVYYEPQLYFYTGMIISVISLIGCVTYFLARRK